MSRANSPAAPQGNNENQQVAGNIEGPMRRPRDENVPPPAAAAAAAAQPPQIRQRTEERPNWTMDSKVRNVLLEDALLQRYEVLRNMKLHDLLNQYFSNTYNTENVAMFLFVKNPRRYIVDAEILEDIQGTDEFKTVKTAIDLSEKVEYLDEKEIYYLSQWEEKGTVEIREFVGPMARGRLDGALAAAKRAEKRAVLAAGGAVELKGLYDSIYNAKWSYVMSGYRREPLGMKVFDGRPQSIWTEAEVDITPDPTNVDAEIEERPDGLEIFVLTSEEGWPYNRFKTSDTERCEEIYKHVYIRREIMRVWYIIQRGLQTWWVERTARITPRHIVIGTPGIGKSYGVGSFLLYSLLHFHDGMFNVIAYFVGKIAYLIYNKKPGEEGRVERYKVPEDAVDAIAALVFEKKRGHIIVDIGNELLIPPGELRHLDWGITVLTSPDTAHYEEWEKDTGSRHIIINCDDVRDMKAFVAWKNLSVALGEKVSNTAKQELRGRLKDEWETVKQRIAVAGPVPRAVYDAVGHGVRMEAMAKKIRGLDANDKSGYEDLFRSSVNWQTEKVSHKLVQIVRARGNGVSGDSYRCKELSGHIRILLLWALLGITARKTAESQLMMGNRSAASISFESHALFAIVNPQVLEVMAKNLRHLRPPEKLRGKQSILSSMTPQQLCLTGSEFLPTAGQQPIEKCEYMVLYTPSTANEPVVDGFFFVEGRFTMSPGRQAKKAPKPKTIVLLQITKLDRHPTTTAKVKKFRENIASYFSDWNTFSGNMAWEMIYINSVDGAVITNWQKCEANDDEVIPARQAEQLQTFWETIEQFQVTLRDEMNAQLMIAFQKAEKAQGR
ncbi:retrotransposon hot spot (RHS) protein, putative [Trypanosoma brucei brucei TREU927]|uniref:Retrotransposon hot spot (RHS) protein, putative n=1 Tax=Trypanosoma brucei brucei (strain 927/4 GUTat10.1) TaxID=185431 RepID=Q584M6_TRYB2|nr:retrotransposon hot spot (RHS) protein, putative [Trypanosoma brucei brucei TREU927]AAQ15529.1 retrotransposon hot spot (RHS) protein, putative [Trypanosoma brucei brucei TREU927]AAX80414.1 retrotransposon hot spot (RHS) protein, putative [Trypanosoma brucei]